MLRLRNQGDIVAILRVGGTITTTSTDVWGPAPFDGQLSDMWAVLGTAGTTNTTTVDILQNGTSIVSTGTIFSFATTVTTPTYATANLVTNPTTVKKGDLFKLNVTAVTTSAPIDLYVGLRFERLRDGASVSTVGTGTYGPGLTG